MLAPIGCSVLSAAINGRGLATAQSFHWSFRQAQHHMAGPYHLDGRPDLNSENGTLRHGVDRRGSTSNP